MTDVDELRIRRLQGEVIERFDLDLSGLTLLTEAATGPYLHTPVLAALAGAKRVYAVTRGSAYGSAEEVRTLTEGAVAAAGVSDAVAVLGTKREDAVAAADIVTNSGFVRPIDRAMLTMMKPTAVVPLMFETWELRSSDIDLDACRGLGILVLGTIESAPPCDMKPYGRFLAIKLVFELGLEGHGTRVLLLGGQRTLGREMHRGLTALGCEVGWFSAEPGAGRAYADLAEHFSREGATYDALLVAEFDDARLLLGHGGLLSYEELRERNPALRIGVVSGNIDTAGLTRSGIFHLPARLRPYRYMNYHAAHLGPKPVLELYGAGLKVGQEMACARLAGLNPSEAARRALERAPAMDFEGPLRWS